MSANHDLIAQNIIKYRIKSKLSQKDLAKKIGINSTSLSDIECGRKSAGIVLLMKIAEVLNINVDNLLGENITHIPEHFPKTDDEKMKNLYKLLKNSTFNQKQLFIEIIEKYLGV